MVEILSKEPIPEDASLDTLYYETTNGPCSGIVKAHGETVVDGPTMAKLLDAQLGDPGFFGLTSDGCDVDE